MNGKKIKLELFKDGQKLSNGQSFNIVYDKIVKFQELCEFTPLTLGEYCDWSAENYVPAKITAVCSCEDGCFLSLESAAENRKLKIDGGSVEFTNLYPATEYTAAVIDENGSRISNIFKFATSDVQTRTLYIDGVNNTRDIGGNVTPLGRVRYGIIYRGSTPRTLTEKGLKTFTDELGIRTELDVTGGCENTEALEARIKCLYYSIKWYSLIYTDESMQPALRDAVKVFTDANNFPVYYHCSLGRDRTGTLTFLLNVICGCTKEQLFREQFLSMFSLRGDGEKAGMAAHIGNIVSLYEGAMNTLGAEYSLFENVRAFLNKIGVTDEDIGLIRANLLEKV